MLVGELVEVVGKNLCGIDHFRSLLEISDLQKQTFAQVSRSDSCRVELLDDFQHLHNFFFISLHVRPERQVVNDAVETSSKVPVIVEASDYE